MPLSPESFDDLIIAAVAPWGLSITPDQMALLRRHFEAVLAANQTMNLTRITDPAEAAVKHYADSLAILAWARTQKLESPALLDIGTGAGFPAVPVAILRPEWSITAIDGTRKKVEFVSDVAQCLGLANLHAAHGHSDHWRGGRSFDLATTRAVAPLVRCLETARPHLATGGRAVAYTIAALAPIELEDARQTAARIRMGFEDRYDYSLELGGERIARSLCIARADG